MGDRRFNKKKQPQPTEHSVSFQNDPKAMALSRLGSIKPIKQQQNISVVDMTFEDINKVEMLNRMQRMEELKSRQTQHQHYIADNQQSINQQQIIYNQYDQNMDQITYDHQHDSSLQFDEDEEQQHHNHHKQK